MIERSFFSVIVGNKSVGKTSLLNRYKNGTFMDPNCVIYHGISTDIPDGKIIYRIHFIDTTETDVKSLLRQIQYSKISVFVVCFALNDKTSYNDIQAYWIPELMPFLLNSTLVLVGTKSDLFGERCIDRRQAKKLQKACNATAYIECSSESGSGINNVINAVLNAYKCTFNKNKSRFHCVII